MKFSKIIEHLSKRGFAARKLWNRHTVLFFGMDNLPYLRVNAGINQLWCPNLAELKADDWIELPHFWNGDQGASLREKDKMTFYEKKRGN